MRVTVLKGGWSAEREVSLVSGKGIAEAARTLGHSVTELDLGATAADGASFPARLLATKPDVVFNALHGTPGDIHEQLRDIQRRLCVNEFVIHTPLTDAAVRLKSIELLAGQH